ncbi:D-alanyl-D-alanine carboxypeptidase [Streptomyces sp. HUAS MG47]
MAGESPDRSEQRKSSGEAASGGRDPRLALLGDSGSPVQVDQATAVFKTVSPRAPEDAGAKAEPATEPAAAETSEVPEKGADDRLKAAVAAWVATDGADEADEDAQDRAASEDAKPAEPAEAETAEASPEPAADESAADASEGAAESDADASAGGDEPDAEETAGGDEPAAAAEAESAESASADEPDADAAPHADETTADAEPTADTAPDADAGASAVDAEPAPAAGATVHLTRAPAAADGEPAEGWFAARKPATPAAPSRTPEEAPEAPEAPKAASGASDAAEEKPAAAEDKPAAAEEKPAAAGKPVDQPTAIFKAVRPPVVDQPTTALKLPPTLPPAPKPATPPQRESAPERPSTFVPLRKPEEAAPAAAPAAAPQPPASLTEAERTKQQPMPPLPPLDLLAELTNTPPPPPSPMRNVVRRFKIWTPLVALLLIVFAVAQYVRPLPQPVLSLSVAPAHTFEGTLQMPWPTEGQGAVEVEGVGSMGTWGAQKPAPIASVTKTMTAYVILRDHPLKGDQEGPKITVDQKAEDEAANKFESRASVRKGEEYTEKELLQLLMIPSANNVARLLARWDAGSEAAFVDKMNAAAKDLGMTNSTYTDPSGLLDSTVSTPKDQLKLAKAAMQNDVFREIVNSPNATIEGVGRVENNNNILLKPGVSGIKTGSSTPAGGNLLWAANTVVDGKTHRVLGIVMGAQNAKLLDDKLQLSIDYSLELIQQAQKDVTSASVIRKGQVVGYVDDGLGGRTEVVATKELKPIGWPGHKVHLELTDGGKTVPHSGKAGDVVGTVSVGVGQGQVSAPVALKTDLVEPGFGAKLTRVG